MRQFNMFSVGTVTRSILGLTTAMVFGALWSSTPLFAANKVPTQRIIVPEEGAAPKTNDANDNNVDGAGDGAEVPTKRMPTINDLGNDASKDAAEDATDTDENDETDKTDDTDTAKDKDSAPPPPIMRDFSTLPAPVQRTRTLLIEAASSGDIEKLRNLIGIGESATALSIGGLEGDPIEFLKEASGDDKGIEILAILLEVLEAGYVNVDPGTEDELFVWPYFFAWPLDGLTPQQEVELYRILTAGDVQDSREFGSYVFYRIGIKPDGAWSFFIAGD